MFTHLPGARLGHRILSCSFALTLFCFAALTARAAGTVADLDRDIGLPDAHLGEPLKNFQGLVKTEDTGRWLTFTRPTDKLDYDRVKLKSITYNFFKEQLYSIDVAVEGTWEVRRLIGVLETRYGKDHTFTNQNYAKTKAVMEVREWTGAKAYCVLKSADDFRGAVLIFVDKPTWDQLEVPRREREDQARNMLKGSFTNGDF